MAEYLIEGKLDNTVHDIAYEQIKQLYYDNKREEREGWGMTDSSYRGESFYSNNSKNLGNEIEREYLERDSRTAGFRIEYPHGVVIEQAVRKNYYRGENQVYKESIPSLNRTLNLYETNQERELYRMVSDMRIAEFSFLLQKFKHVKEWNYGDILYEVIVQHCGLQTGWLDITSDFNVALFFATCFFDYKEKRWKPLTKIQTEIDENHKYGIIFHMPSNRMGIRWCQEQDKFSTVSSKVIETDGNGNPTKYEILEHPRAGLPENIAYPIGFQPFMRCHMQNGYGIYMRNNQPLQEDILFEKLRFKHEEQLSKRIFEKMQGGELIYPHEGLKEADYIIEDIAHETDFSEEAFSYALKRNHYYKLSEPQKCKEDLNNFEVEGKRVNIVSKHPWKLSAGRRKKIDALYDDFSIEKHYGIKIVQRKRANRSGGIFEPWMLCETDDEPGIIDFHARPASDCTSVQDRNMFRILHMIKNAKLSDF